MSFGNIATTNMEVIWPIGLRRNGRSASGIKGGSERIKYMELLKNQMAVKSNGVPATLAFIEGGDFLPHTRMFSTPGTMINRR